MKRLWMSLGWILLTALLGCKSTEPPPTAPVPDPSAVEPGDPATPETATQPLEAVYQARPLRGRFAVAEAVLMITPPP